jgi:hypothetical protein
MQPVYLYLADGVVSRTPSNHGRRVGLSHAAWSVVLLCGLVAYESVMKIHDSVAVFSVLL